MLSRQVLLALALLLVVAGPVYAQARPPIDAGCTEVSPSIGPPALTLPPGESYFRDTRNNGLPSFPLSTNPIGATATDFDELFAYAAVNERIVRIHVVNGPFYPHLFAGQADCAWVQFWDDVFYRAELSGLQVLPVFGAWNFWDSAGVPTVWANNLYNSANTRAECPDPASLTCLAATPDQLLDVTTPGGPGDTWLLWMEALINRWKVRPNIVGWELFSEINKITGATPLAVEAFVNEAARRVEVADPGRPVTASLSGIDSCLPDVNGYVWDGLSNTDLDFIQVHVYAGYPPYSGNLDQMVIDRVRASCLTKPVLIGESGLDTLLPGGDPAALLLVEPGARTGVNHAIWAGAVSGAMNGRALWFEDGYDRYHYAKYSDTSGPFDNLCDFTQFTASAECSDGTHTLRELYAYAAAPVAAFVAGVDYTGFGTVGLTYDTATLYGAAVGNSALVLGWVRDAASSAATQWAPTAALAGQTLTVAVPGSSADWVVDFYDTEIGALILSQDEDQDGDGTITLTLPDFTGSIAFKIRAVLPLIVTIDIRPNSAFNGIAPSRPQWFPVALSPTAEVNPRTVNIATVAFGPAGASPIYARPRDVDGDGDPDVVILRFRQNQTGLTCTHDGSQVFLTGETITGRSFAGSDMVNVVPCP